MGILFDKEVPVDVPEDVKPKPFTLFLEKYKLPVIVSHLKVNEEDDCVLDIEFDHNIDAPQEEINEEVGKTIIKILEEHINVLEKSDLVADTPCQSPE
jgi:hypothetical protein